MSFAYVISHENLSLYIKIVNLKTLHPHEETIPEFLDHLASTIKANGDLKHPIIADKKSLVILDGMHRVAGLKKLECKRIPACLVDYENSAITVGCWYRTIKGSKITEFLNQLKQSETEIKKVENINNDELGVASIVAAIQTEEEKFQVLSPFQNLKEAYNIIRQIEEKLRKYDFEVGFETEPDALRQLNSRKVDAVMLTPKIKKRDIVNIALSGKLFSHKATRHVIPARPMHLNVPLNILCDQTSGLDEINNWLKETLEKKHLKIIPSGSVLEGRRYEEVLYVFEE